MVLAGASGRTKVIISDDATEKGFEAKRPQPVLMSQDPTDAYSPPNQTPPSSKKGKMLLVSLADA